MPVTPTLSSFTALVGNNLFNLNGAFQFQFDAPPGSVEEILQNVYEIFSVPLGSQPYQRAFGNDVSWIDAPGNIAQFQAQTAFLLAVAKWEPRAVFNKIQFTLDPTAVMAGVYSLYVELTINLTPAIQANLFSLQEPFVTWVVDNNMSANNVTGSTITIAQESLTI
jgi:phage baseplate assembly protein W